MVQNIDLIMERGEKMDLLVDKTEQMQANAQQFKKTSQQLKDTLWCKKVRVTACVLQFIRVVNALTLAAAAHPH